MESKFNPEVMAMFNKATELRKEQQEIDVKVVEEPKAELPGDVVGLDGIMVSSDGSISKTRYFEMLKPPSDKYDAIKFTKEEAAKISASLRHMTTGINSAIPMTCSGQQCPFATSCPYAQVQKAPIGGPCAVESQLIAFWTERYMEEFDVNPEHLTEVYMVSELAEFNIYEKRVTQHLAEKHPTLMQDVVSGVDQTGQEIINEEISRAFDLKERIKKQRMKVLESLMATRKERVKLNLEKFDDNGIASQASDLRTKLESIMNDIKGATQNEEIKDET